MASANGGPGLLFKKPACPAQHALATGTTSPVILFSPDFHAMHGLELSGQQTVATMLHNIKQYDEGARGEVERELELCIPTLFKVGLFDLFAPNEWVNGASAGRRFVGEKAVQYLEKQSPLNNGAK